MVKKITLVAGSLLVALALAMGGLNPFAFIKGNAPDASGCVKFGHHEGGPALGLEVLNQVITELVTKIVTGEGGIRVAVSADRIVMAWGRDGFAAFNSTNPSGYFINKESTSTNIYRDGQLGRGTPVNKTNQLRWILGWVLDCQKIFLAVNTALDGKAIKVPEAAVQYNAANMAAPSFDDPMASLVGVALMAAVILAGAIFVLGLLNRKPQIAFCGAYTVAIGYAVIFILFRVGLLLATYTTI